MAWGEDSPTPRRIGSAPLKVRSHGAVYLHHRRRGLLPRQGSRIRSARRAAAGARLQGTAAQARPLSQRRSRDDVAHQHGEVFVTDDGAETDLDLGHYERYT